MKENFENLKNLLNLSFDIPNMLSKNLNNGNDLIKKESDSIQKKMPL